MQIWEIWKTWEVIKQLTQSNSKMGKYDIYINIDGNPQIGIICPACGEVMSILEDGCVSPCSKFCLAV